MACHPPGIGRHSVPGLVRQPGPGSCRFQRGRADMATGRWRNVHRSDPCEICGKGDWCSRSLDGVWAVCRRVDAGGQRRVDRGGAEYWLHAVGESTGPAPAVPDPPTRPRASCLDLDRVYRTLLACLTLGDRHRQGLQARGLPAPTIQAGDYRSLPRLGRARLAAELAQRFPEDLLLSVPGFGIRPGQGRSYLTLGGPAGLVVPVRNVDGLIVALKVRRDDPGDGPKYLYVSSTSIGGPGPGAPVHVPLRQVAAAPGDVVRVTEGELKADAATHLSGMLTLSVPGVSAWRGVLPVLAHLGPKRVQLAFDADMATNPSVARAADETAKAVESEGYPVVLESWDRLLAKGVDDALVGGVLIDRVPLRGGGPGEPPRPAPLVGQSMPEHPYRSTPQGLVWDRQTTNGRVSVPLTNFRAVIATDVLEDDGAEVRRRFEVEARLNGWCKRFTVSAESFGGMAWVTEQLGARAIVYPGFGLRDQTRVAMQVLSGDVAERHVYAHTGWRELAGGWAYLHGGGAIGANGPVAGVDVALPDPLAGMVLPEPASGDELSAAIRSCLAILDVAPEAITFPLLGAVFRAVLGEVDFALHVAGPTGAGKSELAALAQRHFGAGLDARHLPGSWSSTGNALEALAFAGKDTLIVVDDFAPTSNQSDNERAHRDAERVLRAQGNRSGRLRMRTDGSLRVARPPRGLILSTGEDVPKGQSIRARLLTCELGPNDVDWSRLTRCQQDAGEGAYARVVAAYVQWMAGRRQEFLDRHQLAIADLRAAAAQSAEHRRTPEIAANLAIGWQAFLSFAESVGALDREASRVLWERAWLAIGGAVATQGHHQRETDPARRFLELLSSALASGRAHVAKPDGGRPDSNQGAWGWRRVRSAEWEPKGDRVGWLTEDDNLYLDSDASYAAAQKLAQEVGDRLAVSVQTLRRRLREAGILVSVDSTRQVLTVRRVLEGQRRDVMHVDVEAVSAAGASPRPERG